MKNKIKKIINIVSLLLIAGWFMREISGEFILQNSNLNLFYNLTTLLFSFLSIFFNYKKNKLEAIKEIRKNISFKKDWVLFFAIGIFWILLLSIISWDLPHHFHPGDNEYVIPSMYISQGEFDLAIQNPKKVESPLYENQHLMYYVLTPFFWLFGWAGRLFYEGSAAYFLLARILNYFFATGVIILTYLSTKILLNRKFAKLILILPISWVMINYSLFMRSDMILTFFSSLLFYLVLLEEYKNKKTIMQQGIVLGLGLSLKPYFIILSLPSFFIIIKKYIRRRNVIKMIGALSLILSLQLVFFHFGRFYHSLSIQNFGAGFYNALKHSTIGHYGHYPGNTSVFQKIILSFDIFSWFNGLFFAIILSISLIALPLLIKKNKKIIILSLCIFPSLIILSTKTVQTIKYLLPIFPFLVIYLIFFFNHFLSSKKMSIKILTLLLFAALVSQLSFLSLNRVILLKKEDIRISSGKWINENLEEKSKIFILSDAKRQKPIIDESKFTIKKMIAGSKYLIIATSNYQKFDFYQKNYGLYKNSDWLPESPPDEKKLELAKNVLEENEKICLNKKCFKKIKSFEKNQKILGKDIYNFRNHPASWELWSVTNPMKIIIYERI